MNFCTTALLLAGVARVAFCGSPAAAHCTSGSKYWALDKPNNECAEACLTTGAQKAEFWVLTGGQGVAAGNESTPCADHGFHTFNRTDVLGAGPLKLALDKYLPDASLTAAHCTSGSKYWALDKPNNECAEACLTTEVQKAEFWVLTGGQGVAAGNESTPCADHGFHTFNRTDVLGAGPLKIALDKYLPDASLQKDVTPPKSKCALGCTVKAIGVYWACAAVCIEKQAPDSCITAGCLATVTAYDVNCLKHCNQTSEQQIEAPVVV